jgi:hypothetical protein
MKIKEASRLFQVLVSDYLKDLKGAKFNYAIIRNQSILKNELSLIEKSFTPSKEYYQYETKRLGILKEYCEKDEEGKPIVEDDNYKVLPDKTEAYELALAPLKKEYEQALTERQKQLDDFNALVEEEIAFELHKVKLEDVPEDITKEQMEWVLPLIIE